MILNKCSLQDFANSLASLEALTEEFSFIEFFTAGHAHAQGMPAFQATLKLLTQLVHLEDNGDITPAEKTAAAFQLCQGQPDRVLKFLNRKGHDPQLLAKRPRNNSDTPEKALKLIEQLRVEETQELQRRKEAEEARAQAEAEAALRLQEEEEARALEERKARENALVDCAVCGQKVPEDEYLPLESCGHIFHAVCLSNMIARDIRTKKLPVTCLSCDKQLAETDIKERVSAETVALFETNSLEVFLKDQRVTVCPGCDFKFTQDESSNYFKCPQCNREFCLECRVVYHHGKSCYEHQHPEVARPNRLFGQIQQWLPFNRHNRALQPCPECNTLNYNMPNNKMVRCACGTYYCVYCRAFGNCWCAN